MRKFAIVAVSLIALTGVAALVLSQSELFAQDGPWGGGRQGGQRPDMGRMPRPGGGAAMVALGSKLFVYNGNTLFRVNPETMQIEKSLELKSPEGPGGPGDGQGGEGPGGGGPGGGR